MIAYKLFKVKKDGKLYPLYIHNNEEIKIGEWLRAREGEKTSDGKVKSKLGKLAYRPGWHLTEVPFADHIGKMMSGTRDKCQAADTVWCEVECRGQDITEQIRKNKKNLRDACMKTLPGANEYYQYQTNANAAVKWYIAGEMRVNRILSGEEVKTLCRRYGIEPQITQQEYESTKTQPEKLKNKIEGGK